MEDITETEEVSMEELSTEELLTIGFSAEEIATKEALEKRKQYGNGKK